MTEAEDRPLALGRRRAQLDLGLPELGRRGPRTRLLPRVELFRESTYFR